MPVNRLFRLALIVAAAAALAVAIYLVTGRMQPDWLNRRFGGG
jgi:hypothetical protein